MNISFTPELARTKRSDGSYPVCLRISFKRRLKRVPTALVAYPSDLTKAGKPKGELASRISSLISQMQDAVCDLTPGDLAMMDVTKVADHIVRKMSGFHLDFEEFAKGTDMMKGKSKQNYRAALAQLREYAKGPVDIQVMSSVWLRGFEKFLRDKFGDNARAVSLYTSCVRSIHKAARNTYNSEEMHDVVIRNPYDYYTPPAPPRTSHRPVDMEVARRLLELRPSLEGRMRTGADVWIISYLLMGINSPDLFDCKVRDGVVSYYRTKTRDRRADRAEMRVRIEPEVMDVISEHLDGERFDFAHYYANYRALTKYANIGLKKIAALIGYDGPLSIYTARHSWATRAYELGVEKAIINDCLCHTSREMAVTDIYIRKDWRRLWEANRKVVLDFIQPAP